MIPAIRLHIRFETYVVPVPQLTRLNCPDYNDPHAVSILLHGMCSSALREMSGFRCEITVERLWKWDYIFAPDAISFTLSKPTILWPQLAFDITQMTTLVPHPADDGAYGAAVASTPIALARAELLDSHAHAHGRRKILFHADISTSKTF